jgi:hypothetical protein
MRIEDARALTEWAKTAKAEDHVVYYSGAHIALDMEEKGSGMRAPVVNKAWELFEAGDVALFQRRIPNRRGTYEYIAVRLHSPWAKRFWGPARREDRPTRRRRDEP